MLRMLARILEKLSKIRVEVEEILKNGVYAPLLNQQAYKLFDKKQIEKHEKLIVKLDVLLSEK